MTDELGEITRLLRSIDVHLSNLEMRQDNPTAIASANTALFRAGVAAWGAVAAAILALAGLIVTIVK